MQRFLVTLAIFVLPSAAFAHPGHIADLAGHDHWVAGAAIGAAAAAAIWGWVKGKAKEADTQTEDEQAEEQPA